MLFCLRILWFFLMVTSLYAVGAGGYGKWHRVEGETLLH